MSTLQKISWLEPSNILDIGANIGNWAMEAHSVWPHSQIMCIEGNSKCEPYLQATGFPYKVAMLGKYHTSGTFYRQPGTEIGTGNSLYRELTPFFENPDMEEVDIVPLESLFPEGTTWDLIKCDTQGSECDILTGGIEIVKRAKAVLLEVSHKPYNEGAVLKDFTDAFMASLGFTKQEVVDEINRCIPPHDHIQSNVLYFR